MTDNRWGIIIMVAQLIIPTSFYVSYHIDNGQSLLKGGCESSVTAAQSMQTLMSSF